MRRGGRHTTARSAAAKDVGLGVGIAQLDDQHIGGVSIGGLPSIAGGPVRRGCVGGGRITKRSTVHTRVRAWSRSWHAITVMGTENRLFIRRTPSVATHRRTVAGAGLGLTCRAEAIAADDTVKWAGVIALQALTHAVAAAGATVHRARVGRLIDLTQAVAAYHTCAVEGAGGMRLSLATAAVTAGLHAAVGWTVGRILAKLACVVSTACRTVACTRHVRLAPRADAVTAARAAVGAAGCFDAPTLSITAEAGAVLVAPSLGLARCTPPVTTPALDGCAVDLPQALPVGAVGWAHTAVRRAGCGRLARCTVAIATYAGAVLWAGGEIPVGALAVATGTGAVGRTAKGGLGDLTHSVSAAHEVAVPRAGVCILRRMAAPVAAGVCTAITPRAVRRTTSRVLPWLTPTVTAADRTVGRARAGQLGWATDAIVGVVAVGRTVVDVVPQITQTISAAALSAVGRTGFRPAVSQALAVPTCALVAVDRARCRGLSGLADAIATRRAAVARACRGILSTAKANTALVSAAATWLALHTQAAVAAADVGTLSHLAAQVATAGLLGAGRHSKEENNGGEVEVSHAATVGGHDSVVKRRS